MLSQRLGFRFVDTGNMYRAITYKALQKGVSLQDGEGLARLTQTTQMEIPAHNPRGNSLMVDGQELTQQLREPEVERGVSLVARIPEVRQAMVAWQRQLAQDGGVVMAGRDIGTVVLPQAEVKIFLEAPPQERAQRRYQELGGRESYENILAELMRRDEMDRQRPISPLRPAPDATHIDTENTPPQEVVAKICRLWQED